MKDVKLMSDCLYQELPPPSSSASASTFVESSTASSSSPHSSVYRVLAPGDFRPSKNHLVRPRSHTRSSIHPPPQSLLPLRPGSSPASSGLPSYSDTRVSLSTLGRPHAQQAASPSAEPHEQIVSVHNDTTESESDLDTLSSIENHLNRLAADRQRWNTTNLDQLKGQASQVWARYRCGIVNTMASSNDDDDKRHVSSSQAATDSNAVVQHEPSSPRSLLILSSLPKQTHNPNPSGVSSSSIGSPRSINQTLEPFTAHASSNTYVPRHRSNPYRRPLSSPPRTSDEHAAVDSSYPESVSLSSRTDSPRSLQFSFESGKMPLLHSLRRRSEPVYENSSDSAKLKPTLRLWQNERLKPRQVQALQSSRHINSRPVTSIASQHLPRPETRNQLTDQQKREQIKRTKKLAQVLGEDVLQLDRQHGTFQPIPSNGQATGESSRITSAVYGLFQEKFSASSSSSSTSSRNKSRPTSASGFSASSDFVCVNSHGQVIATEPSKYTISDFKSFRTRKRDAPHGIDLYEQIKKEALNKIAAARQPNFAQMQPANLLSPKAASILGISHPLVDSQSGQPISETNSKPRPSVDLISLASVELQVTQTISHIDSDNEPTPRVRQPSMFPQLSTSSFKQASRYSQTLNQSSFSIETRSEMGSEIHLEAKTREERRKKVAKMSRWLGENVPVELIAPELRSMSLGSSSSVFVAEDTLKLAKTVKANIAKLSARKKSHASSTCSDAVSVASSSRYGTIRSLQSQRTSRPSDFPPNTPSTPLPPLPLSRRTPPLSAGIWMNSDDEDDPPTSITLPRSGDESEFKHVYSSRAHWRQRSGNKRRINARPSSSSLSHSQVESFVRRSDEEESLVARSSCSDPVVHNRSILPQLVSESSLVLSSTEPSSFMSIGSSCSESESDSDDTASLSEHQQTTEASTTTTTETPPAAAAASEVTSDQRIIVPDVIVSNVQSNTIQENLQGYRRSIDSYEYLFIHDRNRLIQLANMFENDSRKSVTVSSHLRTSTKERNSIAFLNLESDSDEDIMIDSSTNDNSHHLERSQLSFYSTSSLLDESDTISPTITPPSPPLPIQSTSSSHPLQHLLKSLEQEALQDTLLDQQQKSEISSRISLLKSKTSRLFS